MDNDDPTVRKVSQSTRLGATIQSVYVAGDKDFAVLNITSGKTGSFAAWMARRSLLGNLRPQ